MTTQSNNQQEVLKETKITVDDKVLDQNGKLQSANIDNVVKSLLQVNPSWLRFFNSKSLSPDTVNTAIQSNPLAIQWVKNPSEEQKSLAVTNNPTAFRFIKNPSRTVIDDTLFSPNVNTGNSERVWNMVSPRVNKFDDETAKKIAQSPLYAKQAYDDRGIAFTNSRVKKGLFGGEKTVGGDLINPHKYNIFSKAAKKLRGYTPDSVLGSDDAVLKALKARGNSDTTSQINAINAELARRNKGEVSPDKVLANYSSGALDRILDKLYTQQASKSKGTEQNQNNFKQIPPIDTQQTSVQPIATDAQKPVETTANEISRSNEPEKSEIRNKPAQFPRKKIEEPKSVDSTDTTTLTADQAVRDAKGNIIHDTLSTDNQLQQVEEPITNTPEINKTDQTEPAKSADSNEDIKRINNNIQQHLDALWKLKDENKLEELKKYTQTNQNKGYFKKALDLFNRNIRQYNANEQRNYVRAQKKANAQNNETTGKKVFRSRKSQIEDTANEQKAKTVASKPVTPVSGNAQSINTDASNTASTKSTQNSAKISKEDEKKKQEEIAHLRGQLFNNLASLYTDSQNQSNESRNKALEKINRLKELSPEEYNDGFNYIANSWNPSKNTLMSSIKSYLKGLENFYPEGLESFKNRLKDDKRFITAWNELHPNQKIETKQNVQGKRIIQSPQSQLKNIETKQQNEEKPVEKTTNPDENKLEKINVDAINKSLNETEKVLSSKDLNLNLNNAVTLGETALKLTKGLTDPDKILLAKKIFEENESNNNNLILSQHILQNQVKNLELANIANTLNQTDKNDIKNLIRETNPNAVDSLDEIIYDIVTTKEPEDNEDIDPTVDIEENINDIFKGYDTKTINNLKKISNIIKKQLPEIEYPQLFDYIENYKD